MKTFKNMTNKNLIAILFIAVAILLSGCKKNTLLSPDTSVSESNKENSVSAASENDLTYHSVVDLMAGEHLYKVGRLEITDLKNGTLEIKYSVDTPWKLHSIYLFMGELYKIPLSTSGECLTNEFSYKKILKAGGSINTATFLIQKTNVPKIGVVVAYAKIINQERLTVPEDAWSKGQRVSGNSMAMYYGYNLVNVGAAVHEDYFKNL